MFKRTVSGVMFILFLVGMLAFTLNIHPTRAATITVPDDFSTIQEAVDNALDGDTVYVRAGVYFESVYVNKSVSLIGENKYSTIINASHHLWGRPIYIMKDNVTVTGFTLCNARMEFSYAGINIYNASFCRIVDNIITGNLDGIYTAYTTNNMICNNLFINNSWNGIHLRDESRSNVVSGNIILTERNGLLLEFNANNNFILGNYIEGNYIGGDGIDLMACQNTTIVGNNIIRTFTGIYMGGASTKYQTIYHNNIIGNYYQTTIYSNNNTWDNGYPSGGNYWSDYHGVDSNHDGIGDTPYVVDNGYGEFPAEQDNYPLMAPWNNTDSLSFNIVPAKTNVGQGYATEITVTVYNATKPEILEISVYANTSLIKRQTVPVFPSAPTVITLEWDTSGFPYGEYTISVAASTVSHSTSVVQVTIPGDIDGDFDVDILDAVKITSIYGSRLGDTEFNPNSDIDGDGVVTILDVVICTSHYGEK